MKALQNLIVLILFLGIQSCLSIMACTACWRRESGCNCVILSLLQSMPYLRTDLQQNILMQTGSPILPFKEG